MNGQDTLRSHLEAIRWDAGHLSEPHNRLERIHGHAVAALALLANGETMWRTGRYGFYHDNYVGTPVLVMPLVADKDTP